ncbi:Atypical kinase COQ8, mitochondrial [Mycena sanguinolenta]|uniref:Atypical kinase COQ8, mitochondrial n=1 Tax=Mycena sanguinolenta TaxID=230812 RepID=A0A8H6ZBG4_9AGAR|nr:Atypical kinase COQ8, mitochondrial [Mycena sanguinolenta]
MPPGPVFNWLCVASSACDILVRVAHIRASQIAREKAVFSCALGPRHSVPVQEPLTSPEDLKSGRGKQEDLNDAVKVASPVAGTKLATKYDSRSKSEDADADAVQDISVTSGVKSATLDTDSDVEKPAELSVIHSYRADHDNSTMKTSGLDILPAYRQNLFSGVSDKPLNNAVVNEEITPLELERSSTNVTNLFSPLPLTYFFSHFQLIDDSPVSTRQLQSSKVPSSRLGRLFHYGGLAASLGYGAASEVIRRSTRPSQGPQQSVMMTEANITRLVSKLSQMRGAALKLGQFLSIQDTHVLPADVDKIFRRVQDSAHYMPDWQMEQVLASSLGPDWARAFTAFDRVPFAAASIGQVHTATLAPNVSPTGAAAPVAVKIQFPNIANSIASDLGYISLLLTAGRLLPKGLFLDRTMQVMKQELADECDYAREAAFLRAFGAPENLGGDERFKVPWVWDGSTDRVLVMERVDGTSVGEAEISQLDQRDRSDIAARIIELCLKELFEFRLMQTDPNWSNFLWNARTRRVELVDFGATRAYEKAFIDDWLRLLQAAALEDRPACIEWSLKLGYLTGQESQLMLDAHIDSMVLLATPFKRTTPQPFSFGPGSQWADITAQIRAQIPVMLQHRLTPPPRETYSLNRKLSGAFLLASRLSATVDTRTIWEKVVNKYKFTT